jgi:alkaline phosphatase D
MTMDRRAFLRRGLTIGAAAGVAPLAGQVPAFAFVRGGRPQITHGVQSGDVQGREGIVWARGDRVSRMLVEVSTRADFAHRTVVHGPVLRAERDFAGKVHLLGLPAGADLHYRVTLADLDDPRRTSEPVAGRLRTAPARRQDVSFVWSGDLAGQGWGINPDIGGYRIFRSMAAVEPDFFVCSGDHWYADNPLTATQALPGGRVWRNVVSDEKAKVAETLDEFRGQHRYNLTDGAMSAFVATVSQVNQWDDHETHNNWWPGQILNDDRYTEKRVDVLSARARQALFELLPLTERTDPDGRVYRTISYGPLLEVFVLDMRTYRDANGPDTGTVPDGGILGARQTAWLQRQLAASTAVWKVVAADMPLSLIVSDANGIEAVSQGNNGAPLGRELEIAQVLSSIKRHGVRNVVWLTADVHYTAAHHYDPSRASFTDFAPFWEFVSGPLNAGAFGPNQLDTTFGPDVVFAATPPAPNTSPADGFQFFGEVSIDGRTEAMTVRLRDIDGSSLFSVDLAPEERS